MKVTRTDLHRCYSPISFTVIRSKHNRLGIALQLTTARFLGTFLTDLTQVLPGVQHFVAVQLNIRRPEVLSRYAERDTTLREHTALIKEYYGYHEFGDFPWSFRLKRLLYTGRGSVMSDRV